MIDQNNVRIFNTNKLEEEIQKLSNEYQVVDIFQDGKIRTEVREDVDCCFVDLDNLKQHKCVFCSFELDNNFYCDNCNMIFI